MTPTRQCRVLLQAVTLAFVYLYHHASDAQTQEPAPPPGGGKQSIPTPLSPELLTDIDGNTKRLSRASVTTTILLGDPIEELGTRSLVDCLRIVPGMEVEKVSASESSLSARGYTEGTAASQGILGLLDGRQVYNEWFGGVFWENLPLSMDEIKRIEIIRGPGSFLYGPNAMHGLVNIVTLSPLDYGEGEYAGHSFFVSGGVGSYQSNMESFIYVKREGNSALKVKVGHDDMDQFDDRENAKRKSYAEARFETVLSEGERLDLTGGASLQRFDVLIPPGTVLNAGTFSNRAMESYIKANYAWSGLKIQVSWTHFDGQARPDQVYSPFDLLMDAGDVSVDYSTPLFTGHTLHTGLGYRYSTASTSHPDITNGRHATGLGWYFIQDEITLATNLFLTAGGRLDDHSVAGVTLAPRLAVVWEFLETQSVRATAGYGYRDPSLRELWLDMPVTTKFGTQATIVGNRELKPEEMRSFEIGYWGRLIPSLQLEASIYYNLADRLTLFEPGPIAGTIERQNVNKDDAYGVETQAEYQVAADVYTFANYSYEIRKDRDTDRRVPGGPKNKANAGIRSTHLDNLSGMLWVTFFDRSEFVDRPTGVPLGTTPAYTLVNARVWYPFKLGAADGKVYVEGFNLLDHVHQEHPQGDFYGLIAMAGVEVFY
jgi:iron complex outermembrane receptor protein